MFGEYKWLSMEMSNGKDRAWREKSSVTLFIVAYLDHHLDIKSFPKTNAVSLQSRWCRKTQIYIRSHIPKLVSCELFTNVCLYKDICIWRGPRICSLWLQMRSVAMLSIIQKNKQTKKKIQEYQTDGNRKSHIQTIQFIMCKVVSNLNVWSVLNE